MARIYLVRHAATQPSNDDAALWPLSPLGEQQSIRLAAQPFWHEVTRIVSSPEAKAVATARPAAARYGLEIETDSGLRELQRSPVWLSSEAYTETVAAVFARPDQRIAGWESANAVAHRITATIAALLNHGPPNDSVAVVSHGLALSILVTRLRGEAAPSVDSWRALPFAAVAWVDSAHPTFVTPFLPIDP